jgi:hypothetical protein
VHVAENRPAELEHPTQGALPGFVPDAAFTGAAFASAIDRIATIKPVMKKSDGTFMGYLLPGSGNGKTPSRNAGYHDRIAPAPSKAT